MRKCVGGTPLIAEMCRHRSVCALTKELSILYDQEYDIQIQLLEALRLGKEAQVLQGRTAKLRIGTVFLKRE